MSSAGDQPLGEDDDQRADHHRQDDRDDRQRQDAPGVAQRGRSRGRSPPSPSATVAAAGRHQHADLVLVGGPAVADGDELAAVDDRDPVGQLEDLVELRGDRAGSAVPASRLATTCLWMNSMLPTSRPRVGWSRTSSLRSRANSRAMTTFCWLPPDSVPALASADGVRMSNARDPLLGLLVIAASLRRCPARTGGGGSSSGRGCRRC